MFPFCNISFSQLLNADPADKAPNDETTENIIQNERPAVNHGPIEEMEVDENDKFGENNQEKVDANLLKLESILSEMRELYKNRIPNDPEGYEKALTVLENHIDRLPKSNDAILQKAACTFAQE